MSYTPIIGDGSEVGWIPAGGDPSDEVKLRNSKWKFKKSKPLKEAPNTTDGMFRVAGRADATGSIDGFWDDDTPITGLVNSGDVGTLKLYTKSGKFISMTAVIGDISIETAYDDPISWSLDFSLYGGAVTDVIDATP